MAQVGIEIEREAFASLLETYGADADRWPVGARARFEPLIAADATAGRMLEEARALDRLLDEADVAASSHDHQALADRIMAALPPQATAKGADIIEFKPRSRGPSPVVERMGTSRSRDRRTPLAAGLLAASLVIGIMVGASANTHPLLQDVAERIGVVAVADLENGDVSDIGYEEDIL